MTPPPWGEEFRSISKQPFDVFQEDFYYFNNTILSFQLARGQRPEARGKDLHIHAT